MKVLHKTRLEATSPKNAWYELELVELLEGFAVIKRSGQQSAKGVEDAWFRRTLDSAEKKYHDIIKQKTSRTAGRQYKEVPTVTPQLDLWQGVVMKSSDCEICKYWAASQSNDFPCDECDGRSYFEYPEQVTHEKGNNSLP